MTNQLSTEMTEAIASPKEAVEPQNVASIAKKDRRKRGSLDEHRAKLAAPVRQGYVRRWVNDTGNRVHGLYGRDYEYVEDKTISSDSGGKRVARRVGVKEDGKPMLAYLMEIKEEYYQEDQKEKQKSLDEFDAQLQRGEANRKDGDGLTVERVSISTSS